MTVKALIDRLSKEDPNKLVYASVVVEADWESYRESYREYRDIDGVEQARDFIVLDVSGY
jgi:hypothetical protein